MALELSRFVEHDVEAIGDWIAQDSPSRALSFVREIRTEFDHIRENPLQYRLRPEIGPDARLAIVGRYVILFRITRNAVRIERVVYGGRDLVAQFSPIH